MRFLLIFLQIRSVKKIVIAIDGYAGCGKSTLARQLAEKLQYLYLDTGAMYRAVTLYMLQNNIDWNNPEHLAHALESIHIDFKKSVTGYRTYLNHTDVEDEIRAMHVAEKVTEVSSIKAVREFLVSQQRKIGKQKGIVLDGRDIGTVVFPYAEVKLFITASMEERVQRRYRELTEKNIDVTPAEIRQNLVKRDWEETMRKESPLVQAADAVVIDTTCLTQKQQLTAALEIVKKKTLIKN